MDLPPRFGSCDLGQRLSLVARLQCWDFDHEAHLLVSVHEGTNFLASGLLEGTGDTFTLLNVFFQKQFPVPVLVIDEHSHVFRHDRPSWSSMHDVIELCAGFGGMHQGMSVMGFRPTVAVDFNDRFLKLYGQQCDAHLVCGDVNHFSTVEQIWKASKGWTRPSLLVLAGYSFNCLLPSGSCGGVGMCPTSGRKCFCEG